MENEKIKQVGIHHIAVAASNFEESLRFYSEGLGFCKVAAWGEGEKRAALLDIGNGICVELFANGSDEPQQNARFVHLAFATSDPDSAYHNAIKAGASSHMEPKDVVLASEPPIPARIAFVKGPDGELLEFFRNT